jgi:chemotaxis protein MotB
VRAARRDLFATNPWPPLVDLLVIALAAFALLVVVAAASWRSAAARLRERDHEVAALAEAKARIERQLRALAPRGVLEVTEGKVILQGEILFGSGSDELRDAGKRFLAELSAPLATLLATEPDQMVLIGGHTDDVPIANERFHSNWELSTARAVAVARVLVAAGLPPDRVVASGFGPYHPRVPNRDADARRRNRRIEVSLVPIHAVSSR